jgi:hypothetical protein
MVMRNKFDNWVPLSLRSLFLLVALLFSINAFSQKSGEEIVRIKKAYYGRNTPKAKKQNFQQPDVTIKNMKLLKNKTYYNTKKKNNQLKSK